MDEIASFEFTENGFQKRRGSAVTLVLEIRKLRKLGGSLSLLKRSQKSIRSLVSRIRDSKDPIEPDTNVSRRVLKFMQEGASGEVEMSIEVKVNRKNMMGDVNAEFASSDGTITLQKQLSSEDEVFKFTTDLLSIAMQYNIHIEDLYIDFSKDKETIIIESNSVVKVPEELVTDPKNMRKMLKTRLFENIL